MRGFLLSLILISYISILGADKDLGNHVSREKRSLPLAFPLGGTSKLILAWAIPVANPYKISLIFAYNFQFQYLVPPNITFFNQYYPYVVVSRKKRSHMQTPQQYEQDRMVFYNTVENTLNGYGLNGKECLLRTICEAAETPIDHNGYMGEILQLLLSPNYDVVVDNMLGTGDSLDYGLARRAGEQMFDCRQLYPACPEGHGLFDLITVLEGGTTAL